jgi:hypothetical protein
MGAVSSPAKLLSVRKLSSAEGTHKVKEDARRVERKLQGNKCPEKWLRCMSSIEPIAVATSEDSRLSRCPTYSVSLFRWLAWPIGSIYYPKEWQQNSVPGMLRVPAKR